MLSYSYKIVVCSQKVTKNPNLFQTNCFPDISRYQQTLESIKFIHLRVWLRPLFNTNSIINSEFSSEFNCESFHTTVNISHFISDILIRDESLDFDPSLQLLVLI